MYVGSQVFDGEMIMLMICMCVYAHVFNNTHGHMYTLRLMVVHGIKCMYVHTHTHTQKFMMLHARKYDVKYVAHSAWRTFTAGFKKISDQYAIEIC